MSYPNLKAEMKRRNITQTDLAEFLGCRLATVNAWMQGQESGFPIQKSMAIKEEFFAGMPVEYLFADDVICNQSNGVEL